MSDARWVRIERLLQSALGRPADEREAFIREACADDDGVRDEVLSLLAHAGSADHFLEPPTLRERLAPGARLASYEIRAYIGEGGMGEVYRAHDSKLRRDIAIKILPPEAADAERRQRFTREAQAVAALNHPGIVTIHSVEQSGPSTGSGQATIHFLTMELVDGQTLDVLIPAGGLPIEKLLTLAIPLADAVGAAHGQGIVHRDLKPANVMVTRDGRVKVMDFGLAKLTRRATLHDVNDTNDASGATMSGRLTEERHILGTVSYMSPEQAEGRDVDHRSDVFSLGILLFELATGRRPFTGESHVAILASIVKDAPPPVTTLKSGLPAEFARLVRKCLAKDPARRYQSVLDLRNDLEEIREDLASPDRAEGVAKPRPPWFWLTAGLAAVLAVGIALGGWFFQNPTRARSIASEHALFTVAPADTLARPPHRQHPESLASSGRPSRIALALSPDGRFLVFAATLNGVPHLFRRALESPIAEIIPGTDGADVPFISPNSSRLGFWRDRVGLQWMPLVGGTIQDIVRGVTRVRSASWADERTIVYAVGDFPKGVMRVEIGGGAPVPLTTIDLEAGETRHDFPQVLVGGRDLVLTVHSGDDHRQSKVVSYRADTKQYTLLADNATDGRVVGGDRYLLFMRGGALVGAPFDARQLSTTGAAVKLIDDVMISSNTLHQRLETGAGQFAVSDYGHLVYMRGGPYPNEQGGLVWYDRRGSRLPLAVPDEKRAYGVPRLAVDGRILETPRQTVAQAQSGITIFDPPSQRMSKLRFNGLVVSPIWTPDARNVVFNLTVKGRSAIFIAPADKIAAPVRLTPLVEHQPVPLSWVNANELLYLSITGIHKLALDTNESTKVIDRNIERTPLSNYESAAVSPDAHWLAYTSRDSGREEVWVASYPSLNDHRPVSTLGGVSPVWTRRGSKTEIVYYHPVDDENGSLMSVAFVSEGSFPRPETLFTKSIREFAPGFAITPDGERILARVRDATGYPPPATIDVVFHFLDTLPAKLGGSR